MYRLFLTLPIFLFLHGCATFEAMEPFPQQQNQVSTTVDSDLPSKWNLPVGIYQIPDTRIYLAGHQKGLGVSMGFGLLGVAIANSANKGRAKNMLGGSGDGLDLTLLEATEQLISEKIKKQKTSSVISLSRSDGMSEIHFSPYIVLTFLNDTEARPYVVLQTSLKEKDQEQTWKTRYIYGKNEQRPLDGQNGWFSGNAKNFKSTINDSLSKVIDIAINDINGKFSRVEAAEVKLKTNFAFIKEEIEIPGKLLEESPSRIIFIPRMGDLAVISGVNIFAPEVVTINRD